MSDKTGSKTKSTCEMGVYQNPWKPWPFSLVDGAGKFLIWGAGLKFNGLLEKCGWKKDNECCELNVYYPYFNRNKNESNKLNSKLKMTWLGHASVLVEIDDIKILCDPVFSKRAPDYIGPKRFKDTPCIVTDLPDDLDAVVISHNHYDHMDRTTLGEIGKKYQNDIKWFVPKGDKDKIKSLDIDSNLIQEMDWWDEYVLKKIEKEIKIVFTPTQHWSNRSANDIRKSLWGSYAFIGSYKVWFGGDTGYCGAFKEIGDNYGPFDLAAIPIGAYEPRELMEYQHVNPTEAVQIHKDIGAKQSIGIHWGTFVLTSEKKMAPKQDLEKAVEEANKNLSNEEKVNFKTLNHGETIYLDETSECSFMLYRGPKIEDDRRSSII